MVYKNYLKISLALWIIFLLIINPISGISTKKSYVGIIDSEPYEYYNYAKMVDLLNDLEKNYSEIFSYYSIGKTYENRDVWLVKISDNVLDDEKEPGILLVGAHHGNEKPSYESLIFFINHITSNYYKENTDDDNDGMLNEDIIDGKDNDNDGKIDEDPSEERIRKIVDDNEIYIIPMVNPDGVEANTRKNRNPKEGQKQNIGVDLNRNYAFKWALYDIFPAKYSNLWTSDPESWNYRGEAPFSEVETTAIKNFVESEDINISLSYHSYGEFISFPWTHTSQITPDEELYLKVANGIIDINDYYLYSGSGTVLPWPGGTIGTFENWMYGTQKILSFLMELCKTRAPTNPSIVHDYCLTHVGVNLYVCEQASSVHSQKQSISYNKNFIFEKFDFLLDKLFSFSK